MAFEINQKVKIVSPGLFSGAVGTIREIQLNEVVNRHRVELESMPNESRMAKTIMEKPIQKRLYWFITRELEAVK